MKLSISRSQVWQWAHNKTRLNDDRLITLDLVKYYIGLEFKEDDPAAQLFLKLVGSGEFVEFLTIPAYEMIK